MRPCEAYWTGAFAIAALLNVTNVWAFRIEAVIPPTSSSPSRCVFEQEDQGIEYAKTSFGDPIHEDMTALSIDRAKKPGTACGASAGHVESFWQKPKIAERTILACCRYVKGSTWCNCLNDKIRTARFVDEDPMKTGSRWPDDPCHMLARGDTYFIMPQWLIVGKSHWGNNLAYSSHLHYFAFMHSMASSHQDAKKSQEKTTTTRLRVLVWLEFAFKVAEGVIPSNARFAEVEQHLATPEARRQFGLMFPGYVKSKTWTVDFFFTGIYGADSTYVRQLAMGALLHTTQDAFSDSHVSRRGRPRAPAPVTGVGEVTQFLDYKRQGKVFRHPKADARPPDLDNVPADSTTLHPVLVGAELVSCASVGREAKASKWPEALNAIEPVYKLNSAHRTWSGPGRY